jgi:hypothetical protein
MKTQRNIFAVMISVLASSSAVTHSSAKGGPVRFTEKWGEFPDELYEPRSAKNSEVRGMVRPKLFEIISD